jgi:hypothetical protein
MAQHAKLSPSAAHRWMNCAGSVNLIGDESSPAGMAAMLGTAAHKVIETMLANNETDASMYHGRIVLVHEPGSEDSIIYESNHPEAMAKRDGWFAFVVDDTMVAGVQMMVDEVERVKGELFEYELFTERYLDGTWLDPRLGGTADVTLVEPGGWIHLFDYKNGRVVVEVTGNEQMKNYGVFLLHEHPDCLGVIVHLVQPNAQHEDGFIRTETYTADELKIFEITLKEAADAVTPPNAPLRAGDWCMYCPAKDRCSAFDALMLNEAQVDFANDPVEDTAIPVPLLIGEDEANFANEDGIPVVEAPEVYASGDDYRAALARRAKWIPLMDQAARDIRAKIFAELLNGNAVGDWKLVSGKSNRVWSPDEASAQKVFKEKWGIPDKFLFAEPKFKSPAQIEKTTIPGKDKKNIKAIVASLSKKPPGKVSIAPGSDPREALDPVAAAAADFADDPAGDFEP